MDLSGFKLDYFPTFCKGLFKVWGLFRKESLKDCGSLFWLLKEPVVYGTRLQCAAGPSLLQRLCEAHIFTLGQLMEVCGPDLDNVAALVSYLGIRSVRVASLLLRGWKQQLSPKERSLTAAFNHGLLQPDGSDSFPQVNIVPEFKCDVGFLLKLNPGVDYKLSSMVGKTIFYLSVKVLNQNKLKDGHSTKRSFKPDGGSEA